MTCLLIDDEADCLELLALLIRKHCPEIRMIGQYNNPKDGIAAIRAARPDLVLLDVEMPAINGFGVLEACKGIPFQVIFTTAYNEYAVRAFKYSAIGYLLKPVSTEDLREAVQRAHQVLTIRELAEQRDILFDFIHPVKPAREKIALPTSEGIVFISLSDIVYCKANGNYTYMFRRQQEKPMLFVKPIKEIEEMLSGDTFYRSHHSYLVNLKQVEQYVRKDGGELKMSNGALVPVARLRRDELLELLHNI